MMAASVSGSYGDKDAIVVTSGDDGFRAGVHGLDVREAQDALGVASRRSSGVRLIVEKAA
jgi:hypothetical protein